MSDKENIGFEERRNMSKPHLEVFESPNGLRMTSVPRSNKSEVLSRDSVKNFGSARICPWQSSDQFEFLRMNPTGGQA